MDFRCAQGGFVLRNEVRAFLAQNMLTPGITCVHWQQKAA